MLIKLNDTWRIRSDEFNLMLEKFRIVQSGLHKGEEKWEVEGYYNTFDSLLSGLLRKSAVVINATELKEVNEEVKKIGSFIAEIDKKFTKFFLNKNCLDCEKRS